MSLDRAAFLKSSGAALIVTFATPDRASDIGTIAVEGWLAVERSGAVTLYSGKVELGTGTNTALAQLVADELGVPFERVRIIQGITGLTPDQGVTSGSQTIQSGSLPMRRAAATAREKLIALAAQRLNVPSSELFARDGYVLPRSSNGAGGVPFHDLIGGKEFAASVGAQEIILTVDPQAPLVGGTDGFRSVGKAVRRVDLPAKSYGTFEYVQNVRIAGMWHARVIRPARAGATLASVDRTSIAAIKEAQIVQRGNFVAVAAPSEWDAIRAARALKVT
ncbi:MAG: molybdopterin-dependent oxidoreductase, partial [Candidatus Eremiobacteraeota bacterium]|nr:molybdopterin-dependent oxidoreductase [Candidatus Eremiobacteraeota bacterium]